MRTTRSKRLAIIAILALTGALVAVPLAGPVWAEEGPPKNGTVRITSDEGFTPANGVRSGSGTKADPYVISGWELNHLELKDTGSYVEVYDNTIQRLVLDWAGDGLEVHQNDIGDLRVNQNVKRTGAPSSGIITQNKIGLVGQLRHYDGVFSHNTVGTPSEDVWERTFPQRAVNFDGFNGAIFEKNVIYGHMDVRLHGHHHSSGYDDDSHHHGMEHEGHSEMVDHTSRYHQVWIRDNKIFATGSGYALTYTDTAHVANDRTAASESNEALNRPHVHNTKVQLENNDLIGSGLLVNVFNADDEKHTATATGLVEIRDNTVTLSKDQTRATLRTLHGITIQQAEDIKLKIIDNVVTGPPPAEGQLSLPTDDWWDAQAGIWLRDIDKGVVHLYGNTVSHREMGIRAERMTASVRWIIDGLSVDEVGQDVYYDDTVANPPERRR
ncbi:MAG: hypothetical protein M3345_02850 [Actinomycetota bacterium]|nr:hypothetical protein [Actinomycetota bacterium]